MEETIKGKTILVTGATGMLPSYLLYTLLFLKSEWRYDPVGLVKKNHLAYSGALDYKAE